MIKPSEFHRKLTERLLQYRGRWSGSLKDQIRDLPDFERVEREVLRSLKTFNPWYYRRIQSVSERICIFASTCLPRFP